MLEWVWTNVQRTASRPQQFPRPRSTRQVEMRGRHGLTKAIVFERFFSRDNLKYGHKSWNGSTRKFNNFDCDGIFRMTIWFTPRRTRRMETYPWAPTEEQ